LGVLGRTSARGSWRGAETVTALRGLPDVMGDRATLCLCAHRRPRNAARLYQWWQEGKIEIWRRRYCVERSIV
jgi:hypothetical protein